MSDKANGLIDYITAIGLDFHTDNPCVVQVERATNGVLHFVEADLSEEIDTTYGHNIATGNTTEWTGDFHDFLSTAIEYGITQFTVSGVLPSEFIQVLNSDEYRTSAIELIALAEASTGSGISVIDESSDPHTVKEFIVHEGFIIPQND
jgi:hypothetical protein